MNILFVSDFHNCVDMSRLKDVLLTSPFPDIVFSLGDISARELYFIKELVGSTPIYGVLGNHDGSTVLELVEIPDLHGKRLDVAGISFSGFQGSVRYKRGPYTMFSQKESLEVMANIPAADILISHDKPFCGKKLDVSEVYSKSPHEGLAGISAYLQKHSPSLHVHGHIHKNARYTLNGIDTLSVFGVVFISFENNFIKDYRILLEP